MVDLTKLERFNNHLLDAPYYEVVNYVADYAQQMLEKLLGTISFPLNINFLFDLLNIKIEEELFSFKVNGDSDFFNSYLRNDTFYIESLNYCDSTDIRFSKIQSIAYLITGESLLDGTKFLECTYHNVMDNLYPIVNMLSLSIVLPWKTTLCYFDEINFSMKNCNCYQSNQKFKELSAKLQLPQHVVLLAYNNWLHVMSVKRNFYHKDLDMPQYKNVVFNMF